MTPGVATRSGPAHAKRNPESAGGSAPCRHTTKSEGRAGSSKNIAQHATERSMSRLGPTSAARKSARRNSRLVERPEGSDPPARRPERSPTDSRSRKNRRGAPHGSTNRSHKIFGPQASGRHANIRKCDDTFAPPTNGGFAGQRTAAKKAGEGDPTRNHDNRIPERRHAPSPSGKPATHGTPSQPRFGTFRPGEGNHRPGTEYLGKRRDITKVRIRNNR